MSEPLLKAITPVEFIDEFKRLYKKDFGKLDNQAYFIAGFLLTVFAELKNPSAIEYKENETP